MSPASRSKSKDKKASKEAQKASAKTSGSGNAGNGIPASAYNPLSGTFHTLEMSPMSSASPIHSNGRFRNIDEPDEQPGGLLVGGTEFDSVSNNGSWSGESEDHKDKTLNPPVRLEALPGADNDKREKIRLKNERKHQRQKERRAQELHERCNGYLMSRRLEALAQQLVAMGFSHEQATMALIMNEGRVEESVAWLFEGGEDTYKQMDKNISEGNLKIDISEELARIADMETRYQCSRQEVERAIVSSEGDLEKAAETLRELKHDPPTAPPKLEETGDPLAVSNGKQSAVIQNPRPQTKTNLPPNQLKKDDKDFNYTKSAVMLGGTAESVNKNMQPLKRIQPKLDWAKHQQVTISADKRWPSAGSNPSVSYSLSSPLQVTPPPAKTETCYIAHGGEYGKNLQPAAVREPVTMMQRPQSINVKQIPASSMSSSPPGMVASWYPTNGVDVIKSNGFLPQISSTRSLGPNCMNSNQMYHRLQYQPQQQLVSGSSSMDSQATSRGNGLWNRTGVSPTVAAASSLGLFSALGSPGTSGASSPVDWTTGGSMLHLDYTSIDWSLDRGLSSGSPNGLYLGLPSFPKNNHRMYDLSTAAGEGAQPSLRSLPSNGNMLGLQDGRVATTEASVAGSREWSSPFEEKDLFSLPRQFVSSPSL
ncbi:Ubiquitin-associated/translation elongation factor EF1B protein [Quillaja saponaria]|uniref:Ubiquitin-associated/translation elongation factor EF1B protein n=1 Tax=Quillaja saponaria TaxID=32244 RepID=A0AAD7LM05_QUISA|nr:Ubiquitin-associated/translation elongation factor EF1B protein [Quillaja saponaria]